MSDKLPKQATAKVAWATFSIMLYLAELLVNVYSYLLMEKSVSCRCLREKAAFSNQVTYTFEQDLNLCLYPLLTHNQFILVVDK